MNLLQMAAPDNIPPVDSDSASSLDTSDSELEFSSESTGLGSSVESLQPSTGSDESVLFEEDANDSSPEPLALPPAFPAPAPHPVQHAPLLHPVVDATVLYRQRRGLDGILEWSRGYLVRLYELSAVPGGSCQMTRRIFELVRR